jgi:hypothetical protein
VGECNDEIMENGGLCVYGLSRATALQVQSPEFKPSFTKKKNHNGKYLEKL